ncbi:MAG TPA: hypothetical protein P5277_01325 [Candidatus Paceibacterota bacterium]|nr:hypothetical protein [Candidatus Paceibacterota bacterium]
MDTRKDIKVDGEAKKILSKMKVSSSESYSDAIKRFYKEACQDNSELPRCNKREKDGGQDI